MPGRVNAAEVPSHQPSVHDGLRRKLRLVQIARHDRLAPHGDFPYAVGRGIQDTHFHARQRLPHSIGAKWFQVVNGNSCAGLRQAVPVRHGNSKIVEEL